MSLVEQIETAVNAGWDDRAKVGIVFEIVDSNGNPHAGIEYPIGKEVPGDGKVQYCIINISANACKSFGYVTEFGEFTYDVGVNGKPFFGNIPPHLVKAVYDMNTGKSYGHWQPQSKEVSAPSSVQLVPVRQKFEPLVVAFNPDVTPSKSRASLVLV